MATGVSATWSPSPATQSANTLRREVARYVKKPDDPEALDVANDAINSAIRRLNARVWNWNLVYQDITLVLNQVDYNLNASFKAPRRCIRLNSSSKEDGSLAYKDPRSFMEEHPRATQSRASEVYTVLNAHEYGTMSLEYPASQAFIDKYPTLRLWFFRRVPTIPVNDNSAQLDAPHEVEEFVAWYAKSVMADDYMPDKSVRAERRWREAEKRLILDDKKNHDWSRGVGNAWLTA